MKTFKLFIRQHTNFMPAFWSILIVVFETSLALYILRNL
ncbi:hypothetical protein FORC065_1034 [Yersinia enterocolitica]|nr:hypothetical protein FORC065_1034 [Yersinia enterocolitica]